MGLTYVSYFSSYHPSLPVLVPSVSPDSVYEASPLLFWTIIATAARHDSSDFSLLQTLIPAVKKLLWSAIAIVPHTLPSLQAMSILCVWPFPVSSMPLDVTFLLAGILKSAATHVGLHRPDILMHYSRTRVSLESAQLLEAVKVWCCSYVAIEGVATGSGHQPYFSADQTIERASAESNPYKLPESLHQAVMIQTICNKIHLAMNIPGGIEDSAARSWKTSLFKLLESDLRELENRLGKPKSHRTRLNLLSACFQLRSYWLFEDEDSAPRREGVIEAFDTAIQYINALQQGGNEGTPGIYLPLLNLRVAFTAAIFISKVVHSSYGQYVDTELAKDTFNACVSICKQCSVEDNDIEGRTTKVLPQLWSIQKTLFEKSPRIPPRLGLKSRLFLSLVHDALWQWRDEYAGQPSNGAPSLPPPFMSPASTAGSAGPMTTDYPALSTSISVQQPRHTNTIVQNSNPLDNQGISDLTYHQIVSPSEFLAAESTQEPLGDTPGEDMPRDTGFLSSDIMQFDLLFPDFMMEYGDLLSQGP
ncbi:hypothetical protein GQ53DRAFT_823598 [Thozetella sp. PMI_491]|nr:hypothetical protein GQ53DRAFT_823598 [Thozetella sp. PMI_491]